MHPATRSAYSTTLVGSFSSQRTGYLSSRLDVARDIIMSSYDFDLGLGMSKEARWRNYGLVGSVYCSLGSGMERLLGAV